GGRSLGGRKSRGVLGGARFPRARLRGPQEVRKALSGKEERDGWLDRPPLPAFRSVSRVGAVARHDQRLARRERETLAPRFRLRGRGARAASRDSPGRVEPLAGQ